jgi:hypothetical protein
VQKGTVVFIVWPPSISFPGVSTSWTRKRHARTYTPLCRGLGGACIELSESDDGRRPLLHVAYVWLRGVPVHAPLVRGSTMFELRGRAGRSRSCGRTAAKVFFLFSEGRAVATGGSERARKYEAHPPLRGAHLQRTDISWRRAGWIGLWNEYWSRSGMSG